MNTRARRVTTVFAFLAMCCLFASLFVPRFRQGNHTPDGFNPAAPAATSNPPALRALIVGGGPDKPHNQFAIESNVRYVKRILPSGIPTRILFADGDRQSVNVQYLDNDGYPHYRATQLTAIDGPSRLNSFREALKDLGARDDASLLLYFTGHGSPDDAGGYDDNAYDMWADETLTVRDLAHSLDTLPADMPVTVVMVQCFSGAFGNLLFQNGSPDGAWANRKFCGFFASVPSREAAGCTAEVNEAEYHDFTSYFFAALSGQDRLGRPVKGADYNGDGVVGMDEAFDYTLIHDISIDTPVCTSDVFLRRYVPTPDATVFQTPYNTIHDWATPGQRAVLDGLSAQLGLTGESRLQTAYNTFRRRTRTEGSDEEEEQTARWTRLVRCGKSVYLAHTLHTTGDAVQKARFAALLAAESANPLHPNPASTSR
jgi:hypothetical protein